ncbi:hypothetical protein [Acidicapsa ligni]|uniref:hypothetical protein n=1 Tax=Acidicapsa ligni TaxID=542300 RepID=UPI0021E0A912|nr:hypothetical protein [Acidicapsa ligni]
MKTYQKPSVAVLAQASVAIQGMHIKNSGNVTDALNPQQAQTSGFAYDLDE